MCSNPSYIEINGYKFEKNIYKHITQGMEEFNKYRVQIGMPQILQILLTYSCSTLKYVLDLRWADYGTKLLKKCKSNSKDREYDSTYNRGTIYTLDNIFSQEFIQIADDVRKDRKDTQIQENHLSSAILSVDSSSTITEWIYKKSKFESITVNEIIDEIKRNPTIPIVN